MEKLIALNKSSNPLTEAYRTLSINVLNELGEKKLLEVTSVAENSNVCIITANLAVALAQTGKKVLVIDCNLRNPQQHELFAVKNIGLTDFLTRGESFTTFVKDTQQAGLFILPAGSVIVTNTVETLMSETIKRLLIEVKETYDIVLLVVPSVSEVADAFVFGAKTDGVLLILTNKQDKVNNIQKAKEMFLQAGVKILGCVLDKV